MHQRPPTEVRLCAVTPKLEVRYVPPPEPHPTALGTPHLGRMVDEFTEADEGGEYWVVFGGWDDSAAWRRDHRVRAMMVVNRPKRRFSAHGYDQIDGECDRPPMAALRPRFDARASGQQSAGFVLGYRIIHDDGTDVRQPGALLGDTVMYHRSHGQECGGAVRCSPAFSTIFADRLGRRMGGAFVSDWTFTRTRFVVWNGCYTADENDTRLETIGNLTAITEEMGVSAVLGFNGLTAEDAMIENWFFASLFRWLSVGVSVGEAHRRVKEELVLACAPGGEHRQYWINHPQDRKSYTNRACAGGAGMDPNGDLWGLDNGALYGNPQTKILDRP